MSRSTRGTPSTSRWGCEAFPPTSHPSSCVSDLAGDVVEGGGQVVAEKRDGGDDHDSDQGNHEAVLDGGRTALLVEQGLDLGSNLGHDEGFLPLMQGHPMCPPQKED